MNNDLPKSSMYSPGTRKSRAWATNWMPARSLRGDATHLCGFWTPTSKRRIDLNGLMFRRGVVFFHVNPGTAQIETWSGQLDISGIGRQFGTPLSVVNPGRIQENFNDYLSLVGKRDAVVFPVKSNPSMAVLRVLAKLGASALVASSQEFYLARLADFTPERIFYFSPALEPDRVVGLILEGGAVILDSVEDLNRLAGVLPTKSTAGQIFLRLNSALPLPAETLAHINLPGHSNIGAAKFGIPAGEVIPALQATAISVGGLHFHAGPQVDSIDVFVEVLTYLHRLIDRIASETPHRIARLNIGGGLGIPFTDQESYPAVADLAAALQPLRRDDMEYLVEPGRSLVGDGAAIVTRVENIKRTGSKLWGIVDMGTRDLDRIAMSRLPHSIVDANHRPLPLEGPDTLCGPLCFSDDTVLAETSLAGVAPGDYLLIQHCGAYCYTLARQFDAKPMQGAVKLEADGVLKRTAIIEDEVLNPAYSTFLWDSDAPAWDQPETVPLHLVKALNSEYLQYMSAQDKYEIVEMRQVASNAFCVDLQVNSPVDFISLPYCVRMAADMAIAAALRMLEYESKSFPVWADRLYLDASVNMASNRVVTLELSFSPFAGKGTTKVTNVRFAMDEGRFHGFLRLKFDTAAAD